jgi:hypothetical protein
MERQWANLSILRSTPALLGLFSIVTLLANLHAQKQKLPVQQAAWYNKQLPTFSDALRIVKQTLFSHRYFFGHRCFMVKFEKSRAFAQITATLALLVLF